MTTRRQVLQAAATIPFVTFSGAAVSTTSSKRDGSVSGSTQSVYEELGAPRIINAGEPFTIFGGGPVRKEVKEAMLAAGRRRMLVADAQKYVGARLADLLGAEASMVTSGAAGALTLGTAACMAGSDPDKIAKLPSTGGMRNEVIIQRSHRYPYEQAVAICGAKMVEVESASEMIEAITDRTALMLFNNRWVSRGKIGYEEFVRIGRSSAVPTFIDCAADVPPAGNLTKFNSIGFDLVTFSGGKGLRGPASTGLLMGRSHLIEAALKNSAPNDVTIGRGMKVNVDEIAGLLVAVELCLKEDGQSLLEQSRATLEHVQRKLGKIEGLRTEIFLPPVSYRWPHLRLQWDYRRLNLTADEARKRLRSGVPAITTRTGPDPVIGLEISAWMLEEDEVPILTQRLTDLFL